MSLWTPGGPKHCGEEMLTLLYCHQSHRFASSDASERLHHPAKHHAHPVPATVAASSPVHPAQQRSDCERLALPLLIGRELAMGWAPRRWFNLLHPRLPRPPESSHFIGRFSVTPAPYPLFFPPFVSIRSHTTHTYTVIYKGMHTLPAQLPGEALFICFGHLALLLFWDIVPFSPPSLTPFTPGPKITHFTSHWNIQHYNQ